jgi:hypothetical protein
MTALEVFCIVMMGLGPALAPWTVRNDAPGWLMTHEWQLPLVGQDWRNQVTGEWGAATVFEAPLEDFGTVGVLAHNYLEGRRFTLLNEGDLVGLGWMDGREAWYRVTEIQVWTATRPGDEFSTLERRGEVADSWAVYRAVYGVPGRLVLQTCIGDKGGFYFVIATPDNGSRQRIEWMGQDKEARLPASGYGPAIVQAVDLGWLISISGEVVYE